MNLRTTLEPYKHDLKFILRPGIASALRRLFDGEASEFDCETLKMEADFMLSRMDKTHPHLPPVRALVDAMNVVLSSRSAAA